MENNIINNNNNDDNNINNINNGDNIGVNKKKTFSEYYKDEDFKKKHNQYMMTQIQCDCGAFVMRANLTRHKKTPKHQKIMKLDLNNLINDYLEVLTIGELNDYHNKIQDLINKND